MATTSVRGGAVLLPAEVRDRFGLDDGALLAIEVDADAIVLRPIPIASALEPENYTPERIAEFLLNNSIDAEDYTRAIEEVRGFGLDPGAILHDAPLR